MTVLLDPVPQLALRIALALVFAWSAGHKLRDVTRFRAALAGYDLLPRGWVAPAGLVLLGAETGIVVGLSLPRPIGVAGLLAAGLLALYAGAIAVNLWRGRRDIDCGCAGPARRVGLSAGLVVRNAILAGLALLITLPVNSRALGWIDRFTVAGAVVALALLYAAVDGLLASAPRIGALRAVKDGVPVRHPRRRGASPSMLSREVGHA